MSTVSLCMISKNEEKYIGKAIESAQTIANEIIVVDTGSTDNTIAIAQNYGAKIFNFSFQNNFSTVRNLAIEKASCDWILFLDCDEMLDYNSIEPIKQSLDTQLFKAYALLFYNYHEDGSFHTHNLVRLFINDGKLKYNRPLHETIEESFFEHYEAHELCHSNFIIHHSGYLPSIVSEKDKINRNQTILKTFTDNNKDSYYFFLVGRENYRNNLFEESIDNFEKSIDIIGKNDGFIREVYHYLCCALINTKQYTRALSLVNNLIDKWPNFKDLYYFRLIIHNTNENHKEAYSDLLSYMHTFTNPVEFPIKKLCPREQLFQMKIYYESLLKLKPDISFD